ncbi:PARP catalytic domain-containing protein [Balamuthia mandrillaris]
MIWPMGYFAMIEISAIMRSSFCLIKLLLRSKIFFTTNLARWMQAPKCNYPSCTKAVFVDSRSNRVLDYCGRTHANAHAAMKALPGVPPGFPTTTTTGTKTCGLPGCNNAVYVEQGTGKVHNYCGRTHAQKHRALRSIKQRSLNETSFRLYFSFRYHLSAQFAQRWRHPSRPGTIHTILRIHNPLLKQRFKAYQQHIVSNVSNLQVWGEGGPGNTHRRFHGTKSWVCDLGVGKQSQSLKLCKNASCSVCGIIRQGLKLSKVVGRNRFGQGLYLSSTSSKANDYTNNCLVSGGYRAMFLCYVVVGKGWKILQDSPSLQGPPKGFHSVLGEVGSSLNYDEVVVYQEEAVYPAYLIIYKQ